MAGQLKSLHTRGLRTSWLEAGSSKSPILLFLHGYPDTADTWEHQIEHFSARYQVIAPYNRGVMPTERSNDLSRYGRSATTLDILELLNNIDPTGKRKINCVGHDIGGVYGWHLAAHLKNRLGSLIVVNSLALEQFQKRLKQPSQLLRSWYIYPILMPKLSDPFTRKFPASVLKLAHRVGGLKVNQRPKLSESIQGVSGALRQYRALARELARKQPAPERLSAPTLILWGKADPFLNTPNRDEFLMLSEQFDIRILPGSHWLHREDSTNFNSLVDEFLCRTESHLS